MDHRLNAEPGFCPIIGIEYWEVAVFNDRTADRKVLTHKNLKSKMILTAGAFALLAVCVWASDTVEEFGLREVVGERCGQDFE